VMPTIDPSTISFSDFSGQYTAPDIEDEPEECTLPALPDLTIPLLPRDLNSVDTFCRFNLNPVPAQPPVFPPKLLLPPIPCPEGISFTSTVSITGTGAAVGSISIDLTGGPCGWEIVGGGNIDVPPPPCPDGMSFDGSVSIQVQGNGASTLDANGNPGPIDIQLTGGPCNWQLVGGGVIVIPPFEAESSASGGAGSAPCEDCTTSCCDMQTAIEDFYTGTGITNPDGSTRSTPLVGDVITFCNFTYTIFAYPATGSNCAGIGGCLPASVIQVIDIFSNTFSAVRTNSSCPSTPFFVVVNAAGDHITCLTGTLQTALNPSALLSISNLNTSLSISTNDQVYLEIDVSSLTATSASINTGSGFDPTLDPWSPGSVTENDGGTPPNQTVARYLIATITGGVSTQVCQTNLIMMNTCVNDEAAIYPIPV